MNKYFLSIEESIYVLNCLMNEIAFDDYEYNELNLIFFNAMNYWDIEIISNSYFIARTIDKLYKRKNSDCLALINKLYDFPQHAFFSIYECDERFVEKLMHSIPDLNENLDQNIYNLFYEDAHL